MEEISGNQTTVIRTTSTGYQNPVYSDNYVAMGKHGIAAGVGLKKKTFIKGPESTLFKEKYLESSLPNEYLTKGPRVTTYEKQAQANIAVQNNYEYNQDRLRQLGFDRGFNTVSPKSLQLGSNHDVIYDPITTRRTSFMDLDSPIIEQDYSTPLNSPVKDKKLLSNPDSGIWTAVFNTGMYTPGNQRVNKPGRKKGGRLALSEKPTRYTKPVQGLYGSLFNALENIQKKEVHKEKQKEVQKTVMLDSPSPVMMDIDGPEYYTDKIPKIKRSKKHPGPGPSSSVTPSKRKHSSDGSKTKRQNTKKKEYKKPEHVRVSKRKNSTDGGSKSKKQNTKTLEYIKPEHVRVNKRKASIDLTGTSKRQNMNVLNRAPAAGISLVPLKRKKKQTEESNKKQKIKDSKDRVIVSGENIKYLRRRERKNYKE